MQIKAICTRKNFLRNWVLYVCVLAALFGFLMSLVLYIRPCEEQSVTAFVESQVPCDIMVLLDISGSVGFGPYEQEVFGVYTLLEVLSRTRSYRAGLIQFNSVTYSDHDINELQLADLYNTATEQVTLERAACPGPGVGTCGTEYPFSLAKAEFDEFSTRENTFKLIIIVSDGIPGSESESFAQSAAAKQAGIAIVGIIISDNAATSQVLYSMTSCTAANNVQQRQLNESCPYFAKAASFNDLEAQAVGLAAAMAQEVPIQRQETESSICVGHPGVWGFLLFAVPLLVFLLFKPVARALKPAKEMEEPIAAAYDSTIMDNPAIQEPRDSTEPATSTEPPPVGAAGNKSKWGKVEAGNYLWAMGGRQARLVTVNFGDKGAPPSAPQGIKDGQSAFQAKGTKNVHAKATRRKTFTAAAVAETVSDVYGGTDLEVRVSRVLCCCCYWGMSDEDKQALSTK